MKSNLSTKLPFSLMDKEITSKVSKWNPDTHLHNILKGKTWKHLLSDHYLPTGCPITQFHEIKTTLGGDEKLTLLLQWEGSFVSIPTQFCPKSTPAQYHQQPGRGHSTYSLKRLMHQAKNGHKQPWRIQSIPDTGRGSNQINVIALHFSRIQ